MFNKASTLFAALLLYPTFTNAQNASTPDVDTNLIEALVQKQFDHHSLASLVYQVRIDGKEVVTQSLGQAMVGVAATTDGRFRNGAVAIAYISAISLLLAEQGLIDLDEPIVRWLPELPNSDQTTIRMLANMTAGYPDHVANQESFIEPFYEDPFANWSPQDFIDVSLSTPRLFAPGTNWDYSHSNYVILGKVLERASGKSLSELMQAHIIGPLNLSETSGHDTALIPDPAIHAFTAERGVWEDSTYWNPSWTLPSGAVQVTTISDMAHSFDEIVGHDGFLASSSRQQMIDPALIGFGAAIAGCAQRRRLNQDLNYGLGAILRGDWVFQTPSFGGYASSVGTLPEERSEIGRITIAVAVTYTRASVKDWTAEIPNLADETVRLIATEIYPQNPPPKR